MKTLMMISFLFLLSYSKLYAGMPTNIVKGKCYPSYFAECFITQKIDSKVLGLACFTGITNQHAIVEMNTPTHLTGGRLNISWKYVKEVKAQLTNGFDANVDVWRQCK